MSREASESNEVKESFRHTIISLCEEKSRRLKNLTINAPTVNAISTIVYQFLTNIHIPDVEAFMKHRVGDKKKNRNVSNEDVLLCCRKNKHLKKKLKNYIKEMNEED